MKSFISELQGHVSIVMYADTTSILLLTRPQMNNTWFSNRVNL